MKLKKMLMGLALASLTAMVPSVASAQTGPYYLAPKLLYSHQKTNSFEATTVSASQAYSSLYVGQDKSDNVWGGGLAIGYDFGSMGYSPVRAEIEFLARTGSETKFPTTLTGISGGWGPTYDSYTIKNNIYTLFANVYLDFTNDSALTPYIGAGIGGAYVDSDFSNLSYTPQTISPYYHAKGEQSSWNFAWNVSAGVAWQLTNNMALDLSYRYSDFGELDSGAGNIQFIGGELSQYKAKADLTAHEAILGLRITGY